MRDDPLAMLERELVGAARRRAEGRLVAPSSAPRRARLAWSLGWLVTAAVAGASVVLAVGAVVLLGGHTARPSSSHGGSSRQQLIEILGVLRRPQTPADRNPTLLRELGRSGPALALLGGTPDIPLIRLAGVTPWGQKVFVVPLKPPTAQSLARTLRRFPHFPRSLAHLMLSHRAAGETVELSAGGGGGPVSAAQIEASGAALLEGAPGGAPKRDPGLQAPARGFVLVPDGVAKVAVLLPRQDIPGDPAYAHPLTVEIPIHDNVGWFEVNRYMDDVGFEHMIWYGPSGQVVKRIGYPADLNRVVKPPTPTPETALSRRAERDPSTPNQVTAVPSSGGPHTTFTFRFRLLLNGASYQFRFSGPGGAGCAGNTQARVGGGVGGGPDDIRGQVFGESFRPPTGAPSQTAWCPGTYRVSVSAFHIPGPHSGRTYPPFGTATFTVR
jgi:hypothetical protein